MKRLALKLPTTAFWLTSVMFASVMFASVMFADASVSAQEFTPEQITKFRALLKQATSHHDQKSYDKSNAVYEEFLKLLPNADLDINRATVLFRMGGNYALLGKKEKALETLEKAVSKGFWDTRQLQGSRDLAALRGSDGFDELLKKSRAALGSVAFGLKDIHGKELKKKDYEGKVLVIDVWGTWCGPCRMEIPHFVKLQKTYKDQGLAIIGLTWERRAPDATLTKHVASFAKQYGINYPLVMIEQSRLSLMPGVDGFPTTFFVGRDGTVRDRVVGARPYEDLRARVTRLLKEKAPGKVVAGD